MESLKIFFKRDMNAALVIGTGLSVVSGFAAAFDLGVLHILVIVPLILGLYFTFGVINYVFFGEAKIWHEL